MNTLGKTRGGERKSEQFGGENSKGQTIIEKFVTLFSFFIKFPGFP